MSAEPSYMASALPVAGRQAHEIQFLLFSAGKDSLATALFVRNEWPNITFVWVNPGDAHSLTLEYMQKWRERVPHFVWLRGEQQQWIENHGWPVDVIPVSRSVDSKYGHDTPDIRMQPFTACCGHNLWLPVSQYIAQKQPRLVITGQRHAEKLRNRARDAEFSKHGTTTYWNPLQNWTDDQVWDFIASHGEPKPPFYDVGAESSVDCWRCTAYLAHNGARLRWMAQHDPEAFAVLAPVLKALQHDLATTALQVGGILGAKPLKSPP